jgi:tetratricopeptide (TPR) repeat protein
VSELHPISAICNDPARRETRRADVVFVHGLMGDPFGTWRSGDSDDSSWPHWVAGKYQDVGVWSLGYPAPLSKWPNKLRFLSSFLIKLRSSSIARGHAMHLERRAVDVLDALAQKGIGQRPLVFVCHSLGGLLVKQVLHAADVARTFREQAIAESISDILFLATPHHGADLANLAKQFSTFLQTTVIVDDLMAHGAHLQDLAEAYKTYVERYRIETHTYYEDIGIRGSDVQVVDSTSANPGVGRRPVAVASDHGGICKPTGPDARVCVRLHEILDAILADNPPIRHAEGPVERVIAPAPPAPPATPPPVQVHVDVHVPVNTVPPSRHAIPCVLPTAASKHFGRESKVDELVHRLRTERNTVIAGAAGFGKTALAAEALRRLLGARPWERLQDTPFPDGIVNVDLYSDKDQPRMFWKRIADAVGGFGFLDGQMEDVRAREACRGRRLLLIVEGGEEADGGTRPEGGTRPSRHTLLEPLGWEGTVLWLTRPTPTSPRADIALDAPLDAQEASQLLIHLTAGAPFPMQDTDREALLRLLDGHPLALTWAGGLLQQGGLRPSALVRELQQRPVVQLHDPEDPRHTLHWLFERSVRLLGTDARATLQAAGLLAHAPFPEDVLRAATGLDAEQQSKALGQCVQTRLLMPEDDPDLPDHWRFGHALGYQFARAPGGDGEPAARETMLDRLMVAIDARLGAELAANAPARALAHAEALLLLAQPPSGWQPLVKNLLYGHEDRLEALGRLSERFAVIGLVEAWWRRLPALVQQQDEWRSVLGLIENCQGNLLEVQGDLAGAQRHFEASLRIRKALNKHDPENAVWLRDMGVSENRLGDVLQMQGDLAGAQLQYEAGLRVREELVARYPENVGFQHDLSACQLDLGDLLELMGDFKGAQERYGLGLQIIKMLTVRDPENAGWQRDLSVGENKLGDVLQAMGNASGAQRHYEESLRIINALVARDSQNVSWKRDLSVSEQKLGEVLKLQSDLDGAQEHFEACLCICKALSERDPENAGWNRDLALSLSMLGDVLRMRGDLEGAQWHHEESLLVRESLAVRDPENADWKRDLAVIRANLGRVAHARQDAKMARAHWQQAQVILQALVDRWPDHPQFRNDLTIIGRAIASLDS